jgi:hypothetical protein
MDYYSKYIKYKQKYLEYKKMIGGAFAFANTSNFFIMVKIGGSTLARVNERREVFGLGHFDNLHFTLLQLQVNDNNPASRIFKDPAFLSQIAGIFKADILDEGVEFTSVRGAYDLYGTKNLFMVKIYSTVNKNKFENFRKHFYETLNTSLGTPTHITVQKGTDSDIETFRIYSYGTKELYAVLTEKYLGIETWKPHVSILNTGELGGSLKSTLDHLETTEEKNKLLVSLLPPNLSPISKIMFGNGTNTPWNDFDSLLFSYNEIRLKNKNEFKFILDNGSMIQV